MDSERLSKFRVRAEVGLSGEGPWSTFIDADALAAFVRAEEIRNAASLLVWTSQNGEDVLAGWHENQVPGERLRELLEADYKARRAAVLAEQEKEQG